MEEIAGNVFIETQYSGVTLGAVLWSQGTIFIDAPMRMEDIRSWRSAFVHPNSTSERYLINLDAHLDRTVGARSMECTVVSHEKVASVFRNRPITFKIQSTEMGAVSELLDSMGSIRWAPPDITFTDNLIFSDEASSIHLELHPGPSAGSIQAVLPGEGVVFIGDAVMVHQPPFLANADILQWLATLNQLLEPTFQNYKIVSGRNGLITREHIEKQIQWLEMIKQKLDDLAAGEGTAADTEKMIPLLLREYNQNLPELPMYKRRLKYGLNQYFSRNYSCTSN